MDNEPVPYNWAYEKRLNSFCLDLAIELRRLTGRDAKIDSKDLPKCAAPERIAEPTKES
ncbi:MAG: hypothetical protein NT121_04615 [Chloroflexi bacterium]|nr:hypothetical protein [Chloroflexota bacterium]